MTASRLGLWDSKYEYSAERQMYADPKSAEIAASWLCEKDISAVEDWGCGYCGFASYLGDWQRYVGIDGSKSKHASVHADLVEYRSWVDAIHMRHVLEHNPEWRRILKNMLTSFRRRAVLTIFTPFSETERVIAEYDNFLGTGVTMVDISLPKLDVDKMIKNEGLSFVEVGIESKTQYGSEHIYLIGRKE